MSPSADRILLSLPHRKGYRYESEESFLFALMDPITKRSAADVLDSAWPWSVLERAFLLVQPEQDSFAVPTIAEVLFDFEKRFIALSVQMLRLTAGVPKEEPLTASNYDWLEKSFLKEEDQE